MVRFGAKRNFPQDPGELPAGGARPLHGTPGRAEHQSRAACQRGRGVAGREAGSLSEANPSIVGEPGMGCMPGGLRSGCLNMLCGEGQHTAAQSMDAAGATQHASLTQQAGLHIPPHTSKPTLPTRLAASLPLAAPAQEARRAAEAAAARRRAAEAEINRLKELHRTAVAESERKLEEFRAKRGGSPVPCFSSLLLCFWEMTVCALGW